MHKALPRITGRVFTDLAVWMAGFGLIVGLAFPPLAAVMGVPRSEVLNPGFFASTVGAGLVVGAVNYLLASGVVGVRLRLVSDRMRHVAATIDRATYSGDWSGCEVGDCSITETSDDALGDCATAFNGLLDSLQTSRAVEEAVRSFAELLAGERHPGRLCRRALPVLLRHAGAEAGMLAVVDGGTSRVEAVRNLAHSQRVVTSESFSRVIAEARPECLEVPSDVIIDAALVGFRPAQVHLLPVAVGDQVMGVLVSAAGRPLRADAARRLDLLLPALAVALDNAQSRERLRELATTDPLTEVLNRRCGLERLEKECRRAGAAPVGVLLIDIDRFKVVNDTYGHATGDLVLRVVAETVRRCLRARDTLMRYGGDEFVAVLPGGDAERVAGIARRIHEAISRVEIDAPFDVRTAVSVGWAVWPSPELGEPLEVVAAADRAMYAAKRTGRGHLGHTDATKGSGAIAGDASPPPAAVG